MPGWSGTQRVARLLPEAVVKEMALFGRRIGAERALALGFVAEVAEDVGAAARAMRSMTTGPTATAPHGPPGGALSLVSSFSSAPEPAESGRG